MCLAECIHAWLLLLGFDVILKPIVKPLSHSKLCIPMLYSSKALVKALDKSSLCIASHIRNVNLFI